VDDVPAQTDPAALHDAMMRRLHRRAIASGTITIPAVPGLLEDYVVMCLDAFAAIGVHFTDEQVDQLRDVVQGQLIEAYAASPRSSIVITYESPVGNVVNYQVRAEWSTIDDAYAAWLDTREPPYFGTAPDARVVSLAQEADDPGSFPVLDIGAGTGRNALALARRGYPVDAIEMTERFADTIRSQAQDAGLDVRVFHRALSDSLEGLRDDYRLIILSEVVTDFRATEDLRRMFEVAAAHLAPGGKLVFNAFLAGDPYVPDHAARQLGQQTYSTIFTYDEIDESLASLPLALISDVPAYDYEKAHLPAEDWPPTSWYEGWTRGLDVFDLAPGESPVQMRWLVYERARRIG